MDQGLQTFFSTLEHPLLCTDLGEKTRVAAVVLFDGMSKSSGKT